MDDESDKAGKGNINKDANKHDSGIQKNKPVKTADVDDVVDNRKMKAENERNNIDNDRVEKDDDKKANDKAGNADKGTNIKGESKVKKGKNKGTNQNGNINGGHSDDKKPDIEDGRKDCVDLDKPEAKKEINKELPSLSVSTDGSR